jgi:hypothetical protein
MRVTRGSRKWQTAVLSACESNPRWLAINDIATEHFRRSDPRRGIGDISLRGSERERIARAIRTLADEGKIHSAIIDGELHASTHTLAELLASLPAGSVDEIHVAFKL